MGRVVERLAEILLLVWLLVVGVTMTQEQIRLMPSPRPTPAQLAAVRPGAWARWRIVYATLYRRLPQPPPELGLVWTTRTGRICGLVNTKDSAVDSMTRFYTVGQVPRLRTEDVREYYRLWQDCADTRWVILHRGTEDEGFCASALGRATVLGRGMCGAGAD